jgi:hypothetical protein
MKPAWHRDYEPFELAENMEEDLGLFEAATHARRFTLAAPEIGTLLAATAGDGGTASAAAVLAARLGRARVEETTAVAADAILDAAIRAAAGIVVVPARLPADTLAGLVAGRRDESPAVAIVATAESAAFDAALVPLFADEPAARRGVSWACTLAAAAGGSGLVAAVELATPATRREARELGATGQEPDELRAATIGRAVSGKLGSLIAAIQRHGLAHGYAVEAGFRPGWPRREILTVLESLRRPTTVILGREGLPAAQGRGPAARLALELVAAGAGAVLVV